MSSFIFKVYEAPKALKQDVLCIRAIKHNVQSPSIAKIIPSAFPGIVFHVSDDQASITRITTKHHSIDKIPLLFLHGLGAEPSTMEFKRGSYTIFQVVMKPQAPFTLFGLRSAALKHGILSADEFGAEELFINLQSEKSETKIVNQMFQFLLDKLSDNGQRDLFVERSLDFIHQNIGLATVKDMCVKLKTSERVIEKRFADVVGMPAQTYIRVKRINEAIRLMNTGKYARLVDVAAELNYYDQSHFIRDIKALSWLSPKSLIERVDDFQLDQTGFSYY